MTDVDRVKRYEALEAYLRRVSEVIADTLGDDDSVDWAVGISEAADEVKALATDHEGAVSPDSELLAFVRDFADWHTTADLNALAPRARDLLDRFGGQ